MDNFEEMGIRYIPEVAERLRAQKYADIMMDWTFKFVFGPNGKYKEGLVSLLNAIIPDVKIKTIEYMPTEMLGEVSEQRTSVLDLRCVSDDGRQFAVEVQNYKEDGFFQRCLAYASKIFLEQNRKGVEYKNLMPVYVVAILSEKASDEMEMYRDCRNQIIFDHTIIEKNSGIFAPRMISIIFAKTGNFRKDIKGCRNDVDRWMFLLKHSTRMREYSDEFQSEVFRRILEVLEISSFTQEEFNMYYAEEEMKKIRQAQDDAVRNDGIKEGYEKGRTEGRAEGEAKKARETAKNLLKMGLDAKAISEATGLSVEEVLSM